MANELGQERLTQTRNEDELADEPLANSVWPNFFASVPVPTEDFVATPSAADAGIPSQMVQHWKTIGRGADGTEFIRAVGSLEEIAAGDPPAENYVPPAAKSSPPLPSPDDALRTALADDSRDASTTLAALAAGADPNQLNSMGYSPLHVSAREGGKDKMAALLAAGALPNVRNRLQETPLHWAALYAHEDSVAELLKAGADPSAKNVNDKTPLALLIGQAERRGLDPVAASRIARQLIHGEAGTQPRATDFSARGDRASRASKAPQGPAPSYDLDHAALDKAEQGFSSFCSDRRLRVEFSRLSMTDHAMKTGVDDGQRVARIKIFDRNAKGPATPIYEGVEEPNSTEKLFRKAKEAADEHKLSKMAAAKKEKLNAAVGPGLSGLNKVPVMYRLLVDIALAVRADFRQAREGREQQEAAKVVSAGDLTAPQAAQSAAAPTPAESTPARVASRRPRL